MRRSDAQRYATLPKTAPYLGIVCLALLALASAYALPAEFTALVDGRYLALPAATWLTGVNAPGAPESSVVGSAQRDGSATASSAYPAALALAALASGRARVPARFIAPVCRGALAVPGLMVAITLAQCH